ncbi:hypothetical protein QR680_001824 [Steinernema hermaphroditum]|uniref:Potassium channel domain-containing protein n=1 Tax=Steinernema hermaphroditum TaxID=289476 RepID=A0AA39H012_9BILA|nr:hypothetical protein QR680_001824 [Steinernema hermaphroditum]
MSVFVPPDSDVFQPRKSIRKKYSSAVKFRDDIDHHSALETSGIIPIPPDISDAAVGFRSPYDRAPLAGDSEDQPANGGARGRRRNQSDFCHSQDVTVPVKAVSAVRRPTLGQFQPPTSASEHRLGAQFVESLTRGPSIFESRRAEARFLPVPPDDIWNPDDSANNNSLLQSTIVELNSSSPISSIFSISESRRASRVAARSLVLRRPTISIQDDGRIIIDHVGARWDGVPLTSQSALLDAEDGATIITDTIKEDGEKEALTCSQQTVKYIKILIPHIILVSVLIGYLCLGAWILMALETRTELLAREYMVSVSEVVDDRRPIRRELELPDHLENMHNKWTFPTALLYVLTVLTTCGYGEVSVDTDLGKVFAVVFALVGIPLMFITAADIGKFLSETLLKFVKNWSRLTHQIKDFLQQMCCRRRYVRRKSMQSANGQLETLEMLGLDGTEEKLWFPIGAYVACICLYCSMGSIMFINWERNWSFIHAFHFGFNLIVTVGLGDIVVTDYIFLSLIVAFVIVGLSVVTMCVDLASTHLKAYFTRIHYFGRAKRFLGMSEELKEIVALLGAMRKKKGGKVTWNDVRDFLDNELRDRPFEPHELLMKLRFIDETSSGMSTIRHNSFQSDFFRDNEYLRRLTALRPEQPAYL